MQSASGRFDAMRSVGVASGVSLSSPARASAPPVSVWQMFSIDALPAETRERRPVRLGDSLRLEGLEVETDLGVGRSEHLKAVSGGFELEDDRACTDA